MNQRAKPTFETSSLKEIPGRVFFYPCAWEDWKDILPVFADHIDNFIFADVAYQLTDPTIIHIPGWKQLTDQTFLIDSDRDAARKIVDNKVSHRWPFDGQTSYRVMRPSWLIEKFINDSGRIITIIRRQGFGQFALDELPDASLGVFHHCGDSPGEGGSNCWFFANRERNFPIVSNLFNKVKQKLAYPALLVSDGSLTRIPHLRHRRSKRTDSDLAAYGTVPFSYYGLDWQPVGELLGRSGYSRGRFVWRVQPSS